MMWRGRGQVAKTRCRSATASATVACTVAASRMRSAPEAVRQARSCGQPSRGATRRRWNSPPLAMQRATAPILSASCGRTRTTTGLPGIGREVGAAVAPGHAGAATRRHSVDAVRPVLEGDAAGQPLRADRVGAGEVARRAGGEALGDRGLDRGRVDPALEPGGRVLLQQAEQRAGRAAARTAASASPAIARPASACIAAKAAGVLRSSHSASSTGAGHLGLAAAGACAAGRGRSGPARPAPRAARRS